MEVVGITDVSAFNMPLQLVHSGVAVPYEKTVDSNHTRSGVSQQVIAMCAAVNV